MRDFISALIIIIFFLSGSHSKALACTVFFFGDETSSVFGQNLDWHSPMPGLVIVNKRGVEKTILHWKGDWPAGDTRRKQTWVSKYGSVTFTCYGRDFIEGGMNEAGLMVDEAALAAVYPADDGRPGVSCTQWMQYQLDNFATVKEVINHIDDLRPDGEGWHYLIADKGGNCAIIEYLNGSPLIYTGNKVKVAALVNTTHARALNHIPLDKAFGGEIDIAAGSDSYGRFVRVAALLKEYNPANDGSAPDYAIYMLDKVSVEQTLRSVVYDAHNNRVIWKTRSNRELRWLDLNILDFSINTPTLVIDVDSDDAGNVNGKLLDYTADLNRSVTRAVLGSYLTEQSATDVLEQRGLTLEEVIEMIAAHPAEIGK